MKSETAVREIGTSESAERADSAMLAQDVPFLSTKHTANCENTEVEPAVMGTALSPASADFMESIPSNGAQELVMADAPEQSSDLAPVDAEPAPRSFKSIINLPDDVIGIVRVVKQGAHGDLVQKENSAWVYRLNETIDSGNIQGPNTVPEGDLVYVILEDKWGNKVRTQIKVSIIDDVPELNVHGDESLESGAEVTGRISWTYGADYIDFDGHPPKHIDVSSEVETKSISEFTSPLVIQGQYGVLTINPGGSYTYKANPLLQGKKYGTDTFNFSITDADGDIISANRDGTAARLAFEVTNFGEYTPFLTDSYRICEVRDDGGRALRHVGEGSMYGLIGIHQTYDSVQTVDGVKGIPGESFRICVHSGDWTGSTIKFALSATDSHPAGTLLLGKLQGEIYLYKFEPAPGTKFFLEDFWHIKLELEDGKGGSQERTLIFDPYYGDGGINEEGNWYFDISWDDGSGLPNNGIYSLLHIAPELYCYLLNYSGNYVKSNGNRFFDGWNFNLSEIREIAEAVRENDPQFTLAATIERGGIFTISFGADGQADIPFTLNNGIQPTSFTDDTYTFELAASHKNPEGVVTLYQSGDSWIYSFTPSDSNLNFEAEIKINAIDVNEDSSAKGSVKFKMIWLNSCIPNKHERTTRMPEMRLC